MKTKHVRMMLRNLLLFVVIVVPVWYFLATLQGRRTSPGGNETLTIGGALFISLVYLPYMLPGWMLQQVALMATGGSSRRSFVRLVAIFSLSLPVASLLVLHPTITSSPGVWTSLAPSLLLYGILCRTPAVLVTSGVHDTSTSGA
jgi:hypothetical protein